MNRRSIKGIIIIGCILLIPILIICAGFIFDGLLKFVAKEPGNSSGVGAAFAGVFMVLQLILCYKVKNIWIRLIPVYILILGFLLCVVLFFGGFGRGSFYAEIILAMICALILLSASAGAAVAWIIFGVHKLIIKNRIRD